jgi:hypothetical protein
MDNNPTGTLNEVTLRTVASAECLSGAIGGGNYVSTIPELTQYLTSLSTNPYVTEQQRNAAQFALSVGIASINPANGTYTLKPLFGVGGGTVALPQHDVIVPTMTDPGS